MSVIVYLSRKKALVIKDIVIMKLLLLVHQRSQFSLDR